MKSELLYFNLCCDEATRMIEKDPRHNLNPACATYKGFRKSMGIYEKHAIHRFYFDRPFLNSSKRMMKKYKTFSDYGSMSKLINENAVSARSLIEKEKRTGRKILCVSDVEMYQAFLLVSARVHATLSEKHQGEYNGGIEEMLKYYFQFIVLCESLKVEPVL